MNQQPQTSSSINKEGLGDEIYSGAASFGRIWAVISSILVTIIAIFMIIGGVYIIIRRSKMLSVSGEVIGNSQCNVTQTGNNLSTICTTLLTYTINGNLYDKISTQTGTTSYTDKQQVTIWYYPDTPNKPELSPIPITAGYFLIGIAIILCIFSWLWVYITRKSKFAAAAGGIAEAWHLLR